MTVEDAPRAPARAHADSGPRLSVAVVVCTATHAREPLLRTCLRSVLTGDRVPDEFFVVVDQNPSLEAELRASAPAEATVLRSVRPGLSGSRNAGAEAASSDIVAFVDDDAAVELGWLASLLEPFETSDSVLGAGGAVIPDWNGGDRRLPEELLWLVGCTYHGHRRDPGPIRNPIGCNMAFRRRELLAAGGFAAEFGRRRNMYCDETELALRLGRTHGPGGIRFVPRARVHHHVSPSRLDVRVLFGRCVREGLSKGRLHRLYGEAALASERGYAGRLLFAAVPGRLLCGIRARDHRAVRDAGVIMASLVVTGAAFVAGLATAGRPGS
jgi:GT2 family glycosyltransferase